MINTERIVYSLNVEDIQTVANQELGRDLTLKEIEVVERELGDYIPWFDIISDLITKGRKPVT
ncbi:MAG: hypothetical protein ABSF91_03870 [Bacteroidota bacterium]|jgi:hypothetical protein